MSERLEHASPKSAEKDEHNVELLVDGEQVGTVRMRYMKAPFPFYCVDSIRVPKQFQGKGYGSKLLDAAGDIIKSRGGAGILADTMGLRSETNQKATGMFERHHWSPIETTTKRIGRGNWLMFNMPKNVTQGQLEQAIYHLDKGGS